MSGGGTQSQSGSRTIKLYCPCVDRVIPLVVCEEQKVDLGSIAGSFGLDPSTVKLNGHWISRGVDLVSASVTWRSLLSFFCAKGLSTGRDDRDALIVHGKFCKVGTKRGALYPPKYDDAGALNVNNNNASLLRPENKKLRVNISGDGCREVGCPTVTLSKTKRNNGLGGIVMKRKQQPVMDDVNLLKKLKINE